MKAKTKALTLNSFMLAIVLIFTFTPYFGYITIGLVQITLMHIGFLIGMQILFVTFGCPFGLGGIIYGGVFGISSGIQALAVPSFSSFIFINPLFSLIPRLLMGLFVGLIATIVHLIHQRFQRQQLHHYHKIRQGYLQLDQIIVAFSAATFNTIFVLLFLIEIGPLIYRAPDQIDFFNSLSYGILLTNYLPETAIAILVFPPVVKILKKIA